VLHIFQVDQDATALRNTLLDDVFQLDRRVTYQPAMTVDFEDAVGEFILRAFHIAMKGGLGGSHANSSTIEMRQA
jgi:hypothetical protein